MKAQYELFSFIVASRSEEHRYARAPIPVNNLLFTRCRTRPAVTLTMIPPIACGRRWIATVRAEYSRTFCIYKESQNVEAV
jgi:hypothetical protein